ncbi:hypothetical protein C1645_831139 [Glomus cerebriforme]|uniref:Hsp70 protein n=1 Tax=Glomus cerebriforme TaxID=658196 RepID=A0A397SMM4_9GLOM|nr:hypothetical protein C1645_831139 [Glomus cerebriforme]
MTNINTPFSDKPLEEYTDKIINKLGSGFNQLNDKLSNLLEENQILKQQYKNVQQKNKEIIRINSDLSEKLQERDKQFEILKQYILNLEQQKNNNNYQNLEILELEKDNKFLKGKNNSLIDNNFNIKSTASSLISEILSNPLYKSLEKNKENFRHYSDIQVVIGLNNPIELYKLHLSDLPDNLKPKLQIEYNKAITDYFKEIGKVIEKEVVTRWSGINFLENVLLVLSVPEEYSDENKSIIRECVYNANLIKNESSQKLQFITESEAAAIYCIENKLKKFDLLNTGITFMVVDCSGYTVVLTTRRLIRNKPLQLGEITEYIKDFCGSKFIDNEFIKILREKLGTYAIDLSIKNHCNQFQHLIQEFYQHIKIPFTGDNVKFSYIIDIEEKCPYLMQYIDEETREIMEKDNFLIEIEYKDIKKIFDTTIDRIIRLIHIQLSNNLETCSAMFLVGGFSENEYFQKRIKQEFHDKVQIISVPDKPTVAIAHGAVIYGSSINYNLNKFENYTSTSKVLKYTYGIQFGSDSKEDVEFPNRKSSEDEIYKFNPLVRQGTEVSLDQTFSFNFKPDSNLTHIKLEVYYTSKFSTTYINESAMKLLGVINIDLPDVHLDNRSIIFGLTFGQMEITAFARNQLNGQKHIATFSYPIGDCF